MVFRKKKSCDSELLRDLPEVANLVSSRVPAQNQITAIHPSTFAVGGGDGQRSLDSYEEPLPVLLKL